MQTPISISGIASVSALGISSAQVWSYYSQQEALFSRKEINGSPIWGAFVASEVEDALQHLSLDKPAYKNLDRSVLLAILAARNVVAKKSIPKKNMGVNIGSSRGATHLFEQYHTQFQQQGKVSPYASPTTTLGNISSWVGQDLGAKGIQIDHSVTCSTAMHGLLNGMAWLRSGMADAFLVGGSEAAITPFTVAQMRSLKLHSRATAMPKCESMHFTKTKNTMVLGEAAAVALLEREITQRTQALLLGYGFASEEIEHNSAISENAICFQRSMKMALEEAGLETVDAIIMHAPGTIKGDTAEKNAIDTVFKDKLPLLTSNKWIIGHTFGASGMMSIEMAVLMFQQHTFIDNPFYKNENILYKSLKTIMINAVGFGGNAVSIIVSKP